MASAGVFVSFEGIDGSGKSTQARLLAERLRGAGHRVVLTREPGGSPGAEEIRRLLVEGEARRWSPETELLLFNAARRDHVERVIRPALAAGRVVICDRFADSTRVYQGVRGGLRPLADRLHAEVIGLEPDLTLILDLDPGASLARARSRTQGGAAASAHSRTRPATHPGTRPGTRTGTRTGPPAEDRFETMGTSLHARLRDGFRALAAEFPERCRLIDADRPEAALAAEIAALAAERIG